MTQHALQLFGADVQPSPASHHGFEHSASSLHASTPQVTSQAHDVSQRTRL